MANSFFYLQAEKCDKNSELINTIEAYSNKHQQQFYVIDKPLGDNKYDYDFKSGLVVLSPDHKILFINLSENEDDFEEYIDEFIEDLGSISDKYRYKNEIGRPKKWKADLIDSVDSKSFLAQNDIFLNYKILEPINKRKVELLISLLTGSINDINKVKIDVPVHILDKVKQRIVLFDGDQTRFIYQKHEKNTITIQGLSGTGKTELLLHKLKEIYLDPENSNSKILFTCHNKILSANIKKRIPDFFDFMKVEQQILWNERLWCVNAWGSKFDKNSGAYAYLCDFYDITFYRFNYNTSFDSVCNNAIAQIKNKIQEVGYAFDYVLLDESQDFPESFIKLCRLVTRKSVYVAGDIFQSIFDENIISEIKPDFLLSKCYRTDPRTLMFAHALGMGLFETPKLRWLEDNEWRACGYTFEKNGKEYELTREPLRRFEDIVDGEHTSVEIVETSAVMAETSETKVIEIIKEIKKNNPTVEPDDIGVIFIDNADYVYSTADNLYFSIKNEFGWTVNKAYETKEKLKNQLFVSNKNNVKGLEFPFVICITKKVSQSRSYRNALYMMLTRSFLKSYLLISKDANQSLNEIIKIELDKINKTGKLTVKEPSETEKQSIKTTITFSESNLSFYDLIHELFEELDVMEIYRTSIYAIVKEAMPVNFNREEAKKIIAFHLEIMDGR